MDFIKVNRESLLEILKKNEAKHTDDFKEAMKVWTKKATKALAKAAKEAQDHGVIDVNPLAALPKPTNFVESYKDAIVRVEMDTREELELDDREFSAWIQDNWTWRGAFAASTSLYNNHGPLV